MKILMLKGLPGAGKSTWAKTFVSQNEGWIRINKDTIRDMMANYTVAEEKLVLKTRDALIELYIKQGLSVVIDDTNLHPKHEQRLKDLALIYGADFETMKFDTPIKDCIKNDLKRPNSVGEKVIRKMYYQFILPALKKPEVNQKLTKTIICDIDGTVAIHNGRSPYDVEQCSSDLPNTPIIDLVQAYINRGFSIMFVSGREHKYFDKTWEWLCRYFQFTTPVHLYMRNTDDHREDSIIKREIFDKNIAKYYTPIFVLDDRARVVEMWRSLGLTVLQVAEGEF